MSYVTNVSAWWAGFDEEKAKTINFKTGWSAGQLRWRLAYALNYGTRTLLGGACVSWSRWCYVNREQYHLAKFVDRFLGKFDKDHGRESGEALWGTADTSWAAEGAAVGAAIVGILVLLLVLLVWRVVT